MTIQAACSNCEKTYTVPDAMAGKRLRCKSCDAIFVVPGGKPRPAPGRDPDERPRKSSRPKARKGGPGLILALVGGGALMLLLVCGGVAGVIAYLAWPTRATPENFARIKAGMTEKDVVAIMGSPTEKSGDAANVFAQLAGANLPNVRMLFWRGKGDSEFTVELIDGKVTNAVGYVNGEELTPVIGDDNPFAGAAAPPDGAGGNPFPNFPANPPDNPNPPPNPNPNQKPPARPNAGGKESKPLLDASRIIRGMSEKDVIDRIGRPFATQVLDPLSCRAEGLSTADTQRPNGVHKHIMKYMYLLNGTQSVDIWFADGRVIKVKAD